MTVSMSTMAGGVTVSVFGVSVAVYRALPCEERRSGDAAWKVVELASGERMHFHRPTKGA